MSELKHDAFNSFLQTYAKYSAGALLAGTSLAILLKPSAIMHAPTHPVVALWMGVAGGVTLSQCAHIFNNLKKIENKILNDNVSDDGAKMIEELEKRSTALEVEIERVSNIPKPTIQ